MRKKKWLYELYYSKEKLLEIYSQSVSWISAQALTMLMKDE